MIKKFEIYADSSIGIQLCSIFDYEFDGDVQEAVDYLVDYFVPKEYDNAEDISRDYFLGYELDGETLRLTYRLEDTDDDE